jgi:hypothetical protein
MMRNSTILGAVLLAGALAQFAAAAGHSSEPVFQSVTLARTACLGPCPDYKVTVDWDGTVRFVGNQYVSHRGEQTTQVDADAVTRLAAELQSVRFFELQSRRPGRGSCRTYRTDYPSDSIRVIAPSREKTVEVYAGCPDSTTATVLTGLAKLIDEVADTARWIAPSDRLRHSAFAEYATRSFCISRFPELAAAIQGEYDSSRLRTGILPCRGLECDNAEYASGLETLEARRNELSAEEIQEMCSGYGQALRDIEEQHRDELDALGGR